MFLSIHQIFSKSQHNPVTYRRNKLLALRVRIFLSQLRRVS